jgi:hypothetical protein
LINGRIDHWDLEKERILLLTDNNLVSVKYNFIAQQVEELKFIPLGVINNITVGEFKYTYSYAHVRNGKGMKIIWGQEPLSFLTKWNPVSTSVPFAIFASHILVRKNKLADPSRDLDTVIEPIVQAVREHKQRNGLEGQDFNITESDIVFDYYLGVSALIHNQGYVGFYKKRGAINW